MYLPNDELRRTRNEAMNKAGSAQAIFLDLVDGARRMRATLRATLAH